MIQLKINDRVVIDHNGKIYTRTVEEIVFALNTSSKLKSEEEIMCFTTATRLALLKQKYPDKTEQMVLDVLLAFNAHILVRQ